MARAGARSAISRARHRSAEQESSSDAAVLRSVSEVPGSAIERIMNRPRCLRRQLRVGPRNSVPSQSLQDGPVGQVRGCDTLARSGLGDAQTGDHAKNANESSSGGVFRRLRSGGTANACLGLKNPPTEMPGTRLLQRSFGTVRLARLPPFSPSSRQLPLILLIPKSHDGSDLRGRGGRAGSVHVTYGVRATQLGPRACSRPGCETPPSARHRVPSVPRSLLPGRL